MERARLSPELPESTSMPSPSTAVTGHSGMAACLKPKVTDLLVEAGKPCAQQSREKLPFLPDAANDQQQGKDQQLGSLTVDDFTGCDDDVAVTPQQQPPTEESGNSDSLLERPMHVQLLESCVGSYTMQNARPYQEVSVRT